MRELCIRGQGLAFMPSSLAEFAIKKGRLVAVLTDYDYETWPISVVRVADNRAPARVVKFLEFVVAELSSRQKDVSEFIEPVKSVMQSKSVRNNKKLRSVNSGA